VAHRRKSPYPAGRGSDRPARQIPAGIEINLDAIGGQAGLAVGDRVRISGSGLYSGELARIERLAGVIPSAVVRTDAGATRQVRTIDLERVAAER